MKLYWKFIILNFHFSRVFFFNFASSNIMLQKFPYILFHSFYANKCTRLLGCGRLVDEFIILLRLSHAKAKKQGLHIICVNVVNEEWQLQTENRWNDNFQFIGPFKLILQYPRGLWLITPTLKNHFNPLYSSYRMHCLYEWLWLRVKGDIITSKTLYSLFFFQSVCLMQILKFVYI